MLPDGVWQIGPDRLLPPAQVNAIDPAPRLVPRRAGPELIQLCTDYDRARHEQGGWMTQLKVDGIAGAFIGTDDPFLVSREGSPLVCASAAAGTLAELQRAYGKPMMFQGEWQSPGGVNATMAGFRRQRPADGVFWLYDAVPLDHYLGDRAGVGAPYEARYTTLLGLLSQIETVNVGMLLAWVMTVERTEQVVEEIWATGGEGVVVKRADARFIPGRSRDSMRLKLTNTTDVRVIGLSSVRAPVTLLIEMPGGVTCDLSLATVPTDARAPRIMVGDFIEIEHNGLLPSGKPRHARFVRTRPDKRSF